MNSIIQDILYKQSVVKYSLKYGVIKVKIQIFFKIKNTEFFQFSLLSI